MIAISSEGMPISVVICTYNRSALVRACLESLAVQTVSTDSFEVVVVDNNSTDDTQSVARSFSECFSHYRSVQERQQGLSCARNRGWKVAQGEYVAFLDDDAKASTNWIEVLLGIVSEHHPDIVGGPIYPYYTTPKPEWFKDEYEIRIHQKETGWMRSGFISGSNLVIRRALLEEISGFDTRYGMSGGELAYGEDTEFVKRARKAGKSIYYSLDLAVLHHVPHQKMDVLYAMNAAFRRGLTTHSLWSDGFGPAEVVKLYRTLDDLFTKLHDAVSDEKFDKKRYPFRESYIFETCLPDIQSLGGLVGNAKRCKRIGHRFFDFIKWFTSKR